MKKYLIILSLFVLYLFANGAVAPRITALPKATSVNTGERATFSVTATGTGTLSYQWCKNGVPITGATSTTLSIENAKITDNGNYTVIVTDANGSIVSDAAQNVKTANSAWSSYFIKDDGGLWGMGSNMFGTLRQPASEYPDITSPIQIDTKVMAVSSGLEFLMYLKIDGTLWTSGMGTRGELGRGIITTNPQSPQIPSMIMTQVAAISAGDRHALFIKKDGTLWGMGSNESGQLGDGSTTDRFSPVQIASNVIAVCIGGSSFFLKDDGTMWGMGTGAFGDGSNYTTHLNPIQVASNIRQLPNSMRSALQTVYIKNDNTLWGWGRNESYTLGDIGESYPLKAVQIAKDVASVDIVNGHTLFVKLDGTLWGMGENWGTLGDGTMANRNVPVMITDNVSSVSTSQLHTTIVKKDGTRWVCGRNATGQLGVGGYTLRSEPVQVATNVTSMGCGNFETFYTRSDGTLWGAGFAANGLLGDGSEVDKSIFVKIADDCDTYQDCVNSGTASLFTKKDGTLWGMGYNNSGYFGAGIPQTKILSPVQIASNVTSAATGYQFILILKKDGTLWGTGNNGYGQLGIMPNGWEPETRQLASNVVQVSAGPYSSLIILSNGTLQAAGADLNFVEPGDLKDPNINHVFTTVATDVKKCIGGNLYIKTDGTLWGIGKSPGFFFTKFGLSEHHQIATNVVAASSDGSTMIFLKTDGTLWGMGDNRQSALGKGAAWIMETPVQIASNVISCGMSSGSSAWIKSDGSLWTMGYNAYGQLGDGRIVHSLNFIKVTEGLSAGASLVVAEAPIVVPAQPAPVSSTSSGGGGGGGGAVSSSFIGALGLLLFARRVSRRG